MSRQRCADCKLPKPPDRYFARGLCVRCYMRHHKAGTLIDYERPTRPNEELLAEWDELRRDGYNREQAAHRIGVTPYALAKAIQRANRKAAA